MSTSSLTPDLSGGLASAVPSNTPTNYVEQSSQNPAPAVAAAPDVSSLPPNGPRLTSALARIVGTVEPRASQPSPSSGGDVDDGDNTGPRRSNLGNVVGKVLSTINTGLAGVQSRGRPSVFNGMVQGAQAVQQADANQQALKFKDFDTQVRLAQLNHQEKVWQNEDQDRIDQLDQSAKTQVASMGDKYGQTYDFVPNDDNGQAALTHMGMKQLQDGSVSLPEGVIAAPHGWYIPNKSSQEQSKANTQHFNDQSQFFGVPGTGGQPVNPKAYFAFNNQLLHGQNPDGSFMHSDQIKSLITTAQQRLDEYNEKPNADHTVVAEAQRHIDDLTNLSEKASDREDDASTKATANAAALAGAKAKAVADSQQQDKINLQNNAAANKAASAKADSNMYVGTDAAGNQIAGTNDDLKTAGAQGVTKLGADDQKKVLTARQLTSPSGLFSLIKQDMLNLDAKGKMGSSATARFNDALLSKAGSDPDYAPLFVHTHLLATALMQAHVGSRGSSDMMDEFKSLANSGKMNAPTLRSALGAEYSYVKEKAMLPKKQPSNGGGQ